MAKTQITGSQVLDRSITIDDIDTTSAGKALVTRILAGNGISLQSTGADTGTGVVTVSSGSDIRFSYLDATAYDGTTDWSVYPDGFSILFPNEIDTWPASASDIQVQTIKSEENGASQFLIGDGHKKYRYATAQPTFTRTTVEGDFSGTAGTLGGLEGDIYRTEGGTLDTWIAVDGTNRAYFKAGVVAKLGFTIGTNLGQVITESFEAREPFSFYTKFTNIRAATLGGGANFILAVNWSKYRFQINFDMNDSCLVIAQTSDTACLNAGMIGFNVISPAFAAGIPDVLEVVNEYDGNILNFKLVGDGTDLVIFNGAVDFSTTSTSDLVTSINFTQGGAWNPVFQDNLYIEQMTRSGKVLTQPFGIVTTQEAPSFLNPLPSWTGWQTWDDVNSVNSLKGDVVLDAAAVGADSAGSAAQAYSDSTAYTDTAINNHEAEIQTYHQKIETLLWMGGM